jgi:hypothetical protein
VTIKKVTEICAQRAISLTEAGLILFLPVDIGGVASQCNQVVAVIHGPYAEVSAIFQHRYLVDFKHVEMTAPLPAGQLVAENAIGGHFP